jgi:hypothetical protein
LGEEKTFLQNIGYLEGKNRIYPDKMNAKIRKIARMKILYCNFLPGLLK